MATRFTLYTATLIKTNLPRLSTRRPHSLHLHFSSPTANMSTTTTTTNLNLPTTIRTLLQPSVTSPHLISTTLPLPAPSHPDDVLVRVHATSPCAGELTWAANFPQIIPSSKHAQLIPCQDLSGTVITPAASGAGGFVPGEAVYCRVDAARPGAGREYALPRAQELARVPAGLGWVEAAATPLSALTAWQGLFVQGGLDGRGVKGDAGAREKNGRARVLVTGAGGGVGSWLVQLAKLAGAKAVVAVCGPGKVDAVRALGADEVVNYKETSVEEWVAADRAAREVDLVVDVVGGKTLAGCWAAVREGGAMVGINTPPDVAKPEGTTKQLAKSVFFIVEPLGSNLEEVGELIAAGKVRPTVDSVWAFDDFQKAFDRVESGHANGKVVIKVSDEA